MSGKRYSVLVVGSRSVEIKHLSNYQPGYPFHVCDFVVREIRDGGVIVTVYTIQLESKVVEQFRDGSKHALHEYLLRHIRQATKIDTFKVAG
jgi:hypothetical protein